MDATPDSIYALRRALERKQRRLTATFNALLAVEEGRRGKAEASRTGAHLTAVLLRLIDAEDPLTPARDADPLVTAEWLARLPIDHGKGKAKADDAREPRAGWYVNPEVRGCPPLYVVNATPDVEYYLEGERPADALTVSLATFDELLRAGYEPAEAP